MFKMVLAGSDTTITVVDDAGTLVKERVKVINNIILLFASLEQGNYLHLSSGAGRDKEIKK
eukprot:scaffold27732_cov228-Skeletonema_menzelii.AAC.1